MTKAQPAKKDAKKAKQVHTPNPPGLPASLAPRAAAALRPKKR